MRRDEKRVSSQVTRNAMALAVSALLFGAVNASAQSDIVLQASNASARAGRWAVVSDSGAAGGAKIRHADGGAAKIDHGAASPANYFELTFSATSGVPYRLWVHGRADGDDWDNDSVFVQFSGSVNSSGGAVYRIGTTSATEVNLEECKGCGLERLAVAGQRLGQRRARVRSSTSRRPAPSACASRRAKTGCRSIGSSCRRRTYLKTKPAETSRQCLRRLRRSDDSDDVTASSTTGRS